MEVSGFIYYIVYVLAAVIIFRSIRWFLDPYFVYSRRSNNKEIELYINGKKTDSQGIPFLLRQETASTKGGDTTINQSDICDLTLVVPCYNEEKRLPAMLAEHMDYIKRL